jgi:hypothetical protein
MFFFFCKEALLFFENQPVLHKPSQYILRKPPQIFSKSTRSPDQMGSYFFAKKPFPLSKINPCCRDPLNIFCGNLLRFFSNQPTVRLWLYLFFLKIATTSKLHSKSQKNRKLENQVDLKSSRVYLCSASIICHVLVRIFPYKFLPMLFRGKIISTDTLKHA